MTVDVRARQQPAIFGSIVGADGPHPEYADKLMLFGQFVGSWDLEAEVTSADGVARTLHGEWHFFWGLEGRAILDVIMGPPIGERDPSKWLMGDYQLAVRFYQPGSDTWDVTTISPVFNQVIRLAARQDGERILLEGTTPDGKKALRWTWNDITPRSVHWVGEVSTDGGRTWTVNERINLTRRDA